MRKNRIFSLSILITTLLTLAIFYSCDKDDYGYPPTYGSVYTTNQDPHVGDTIVVKAQVLDSGNGIYKGVFTWTVNGASTKKTVIDPTKSVPTYSFVATTAGSYTVTMRATFNMSKSTENGQIYSSASANAGTFTVSN